MDELIERLNAVVERAWKWDYTYPGNLNIESLIVDLRKEAGEAAAALRAAAQRESELRKEINNLMIGYVSVLESARDRIIELGGSCDSVEMLEISDPYLRQARAIIEKHKGRSNVE